MPRNSELSSGESIPAGKDDVRLLSSCDVVSPIETAPCLRLFPPRKITKYRAAFRSLVRLAPAIPNRFASPVVIFRVESSHPIAVTTGGICEREKLDEMLIEPLGNELRASMPRSHARPRNNRASRWVLFEEREGAFQRLRSRRNSVSLLSCGGRKAVTDGAGRVCLPRAKTRTARGCPSARAVRHFSIARPSRSSGVNASGRFGRLAKWHCFAVCNSLQDQSPTRCDQNQFKLGSARRETRSKVLSGRSADLRERVRWRGAIFAIFRSLCCSASSAAVRATAFAASMMNAFASACVRRDLPIRCRQTKRALTMLSSFPGESAPSGPFLEVAQRRCDGEDGQQKNPFHVVSTL